MRSEESINRDPSNEFLSGYPRLRLDAESIRDTLLAVGGNLDLSPAGQHPFPAPHTWGYTQHNPFKAVYDSRHRSVYLMTQRIQRHPYLAIFDGADPSSSTPARMVSTTPLQALFLLNDPLVHEQSKLIAERIAKSSDNVDNRIALAFELLFSRAATDEETAAARSFLQQAESLASSSGSAANPGEAWQALIRSLLRVNEFVYLD